MTIGLIVGSYFLPLKKVKPIWPCLKLGFTIIEVATVTFVAIKVRSAIQVQRESQGFTLDFFSAIKSICYEIPKILVVPFTWNGCFFTMYFINWKEKKLRKMNLLKKIVDTSIIWSVMIINWISNASFLFARWVIKAAWF
jgi:hypothetical protein